MLLDAPTFVTQLTPEQALGIVQKSMASKNWRKYEVQEIKLVYTPYWLFSFDVLAEGAAPSGKAALNAFTGELNEFVPVIVEKPLKKTKSVEAECEIESTTVSLSEVKETAAIKIAANVGLKKENIAVSAVTKYYLPAYRIWLSVGEESYSINVDACLGASFGLEAVPAREKTWGEVTSETVEKMKSPKGWVELSGKAVSAVGGAVTGKKKGPSPPTIWILLLAVIIVLAWLVFLRQPSISIDCRVDEKFLGEKPLFGEASLKPLAAANNSLQIKGICSFTNRESQPQNARVKVFIKEDGRQTTYWNFTDVINLPPSQTPTLKEFTITWPKKTGVQYYFAFEKI